MLRVIFAVGLLLAMAGDVFAQGLGIGAGLDDLHKPPGLGGGGGGGACSTNFVFDWSVATGCNSITAVVGG